MNKCYECDKHPGVTIYGLYGICWKCDEPEKVAEIADKMAKKEAFPCTSWQGCLHNVPYSYIKMGVTTCRKCTDVCLTCKKPTMFDKIATAGMYDGCCFSCLGDKPI